MDGKALRGSQALRPEFCAHLARLMSFKTKKSVPKGSRWPHPESFHPTPSILASAGYFHDPVEGEPDRTTCWMCGESMKGWAEGDDPWTLHLRWSSRCHFARLAFLEHQRDTRTQSWSDAPGQDWGQDNEWFPRGASMIEARLATFGGGADVWKHEGKEGVPSRVELARAGFHFTPNLFKKGRKYDMDDTTSCCYCHRSVTEWEADDDPVSVHLKKGPCIFFTAVQPPKVTQASNGPSRKTKTSKIRPNSAAETSLMVSAVDAVVASDQRETNGKSTFRQKKASSTTESSNSNSNRSLHRRVPSTRSVLPSEESDVPDPDEISAVRSRPLRAAHKAAYVIASSPDPLDHPSSKPPVTLSKSTRQSRSTSKAASSSATTRASNNRGSRPRTRVGSNASGMADTSSLQKSFAADTSKTIDKSLEVDKSQGLSKKPSRSRKPSKTIIQDCSPTLASDSEGPVRPTRPLQARTNEVIGREEHNAHSSEDDKSEVEALSPISSLAPGPESVASRLTTKNEGRPDEQAGNTSVSAHGLSAKTIFAAHNPQAPQLYHGRLPIAQKAPSCYGDVKTTDSKPGDSIVNSDHLSASVQTESRAVLDEYFGQPTAPLPPGWLVNPFNPARPFPPLTEEEGKMPLGEYFAYRAKQEEEAFLEWIEDKCMKPWLEAVEKGREVVEELVGPRNFRKSATVFQSAKGNCCISPAMTKQNRKLNGQTGAR